MRRWLGIALTVVTVLSCSLLGAGVQAREGFVDVPGGRIWYRIAGSGSRTPLVLLHGGPGVSSEYLNPLGALADERPVIFYDQLGAGRSDKPTDLSLWRVERFVEELRRLRAALALGEITSSGIHGDRCWPQITC